jgi:hypothetical protein
MEEAAQDDPPKLQTSFSVYDGCSGKSKKKALYCQAFRFDYEF